MNRIEFVVTDDRLIDVLVDGLSLSSALGGELIRPEDFPLLINLWRGRSTPAPTWSEAPAGTAPLFNCTCGFFGCGGSTITVRTGRQTIRWTIGGPNGPGDRVAVGPFTFHWAQFEQARRAAMSQLVASLPHTSASTTKPRPGRP